MSVDNSEIPLKDKLLELKKYLELFVQSGRRSEAEQFFKRVFLKSLARALLERSKFDNDPEIQGLIALAQAVFGLEDAKGSLPSVVIDCYASLGDEGIIGRKMIDGETH